VDEAAEQTSIIDRCNLSVLRCHARAISPSGWESEGSNYRLPSPLATARDGQPARRTFDASLEALRRLNAVGYAGEPRKRLTLMAAVRRAFLARTR
jgi:hypothetical protein